MTRIGGGLIVLAAGATLMGCLGEPAVSERWTLLDLLSVTPPDGDVVEPGKSATLRVHGEITYRALLTASVIADVRRATESARLRIAPDAPRVAMAHDIDWLLAHSVSLGQTSELITGFDHLIQGVELELETILPAAEASGDSPAGPAVYLVLYLGDVSEIELDSGQDSTVVLPYMSEEREILPVGLDLRAWATPENQP